MPTVIRAMTGPYIQSIELNIQTEVRMAGDTYDLVELHGRGSCQDLAAWQCFNIGNSDNPCLPLSFFGEPEARKQKRYLRGLRAALQRQ
jgi:hypothetical protein